MSLTSLVKRWCLGTFQGARSPVMITVSIQSFLNQSKHSWEYFVCHFTIFFFLDYFIIHFIVGKGKKLSKKKSKILWRGNLKNPAKHLFIWAVLMNRMSLAKLFWRIGSDHIGRIFSVLWNVIRKGYFTDYCGFINIQFLWEK